VILADDNLARIVTAVEGGRGLYDILMKYVRVFGTVLLSSSQWNLPARRDRVLARTELGELADRHIGRAKSNAAAPRGVTP
jgi:hypothetical protein